MKSPIRIAGREERRLLFSQVVVGLLVLGVAWYLLTMITGHVEVKIGPVTTVQQSP